SRGSASGIHFFENIGSGWVGQTGMPQVFFTTTPATTQGVISSSNTIAIPWVIVSQRPTVASSEVTARWAGYSSTMGVTPVATTLYTGNFGSAPAGSNVLFIGPTQANQTVQLSGSNALASVVLEPQADGTTINIGGAGQINTLGILLSGTRDLSITGGQLFATSGSGPRALVVASPAARLLVGSSLAGGNQPVVIGGAGTVVLTGTTNQIGFSSPQNVSLAGGTLRVTSTNFQPATAVVCFRGGVLEYDVSAANYVFNLALGTTGNRVNWSTSTELGSGGFSAYSNVAGRRLFVNLTDGSGNTATLTWNSGNFLADGYALQFGSPGSNATVAWQNPIRLDNLTPGRYTIREVQVTRGMGNDADRTVLVGVLSGSTTTDLLKTGQGTLELAGLNTYRGNTLIREGTLVVADNASIGTADSRSGHVIVGSGARLAGTGTLQPDDSTGKQVVVQPGGTIRGGHPNESTGRTGVLNVYGPLTLSSSATEAAVVQCEVQRTGPNAATASRIDVGAPFYVDLELGGHKLAIELINPAGSTALRPDETYTFPLLTTTGEGRFRLNGTVLAPDTVIDPARYEIRPALYVSSYDYQLRIVSNGINGGSALVLTMVPVPEPTGVLAIIAFLGLGFWFRQRRQRNHHASN
ncbi:MAG: autotransporter-associated beta strand repeat-containing protein, partial [Gemmataceae bacterium]|nr:autotransporter-associated beta strand repeat-containing protein [Gemmataceae bacterium]